MRLLQRTYEKYQQEGLSPTVLSAGEYILQNTTEPISSVILNNVDVLRREDLLKKDKIIRLDYKNTLNKEHSIPFGLETNSNNYRYMPRYAFSDQYVVELNDIELVGPDAIPITESNEVVGEAIETSLEGGYRLEQAVQNLMQDPDFFRSFFQRTESEQYQCVCSLTTSWNNYYHWMIEHLPKLRAVEAFEKRNNIPPTLLIPSDPPSYITESLKLAGYDPSDCIEWNGGRLKTNQYIQPTFTEPTAEVCHWLRDRVLSNLSPKSSENKSPERIYISRRKTSNRNIVNEPELEKLLRQFDFKTYTTEDLCLSEQVRLFRDAEVMIGVHGAGLTNMIWSDQITVIEIFNEVVKPPYFAISQELGHDYYPVQGNPVTNDSLNSDIRVNVSKLKELFTRINL